MLELAEKAVFLHEFMAQNGGSLPVVSTSQAERVVGRWCRAVAGGNDGLFRQRLAWDGWPQGQVLIRRVALGLAAANNGKAFEVLLSVVDQGQSLQTAAEALGAWVVGQVGRRWPRSWRLAHLPGLRAACTRQLAELLQLAAGETAVPAGEFFRQRPIVARWVCERAWQWVRAAIRLAWRFHRDRERLALAFSWPSRETTPTVCRWALSDWHNGDSVVALELGELPTIFYKPRSLQPELVLGKWIELFRRLGVPVAPLAPMLPKGTYGWVKEVKWARLESKAEVRAWFFSAGALLAVAWLLGIKDLHWENVVASQEGPVIVDGEIWAQPAFCSEKSDHSAVFTSGLLTMPVMRGEKLFDDGALLGGFHPSARSLPLWRGRRASPFDFAEEIVKGFQESLERISRVPKEYGLASSCWVAMDGLKVRYLARASEAYARFLLAMLRNQKVKEGWHVSLLAEALLRPLVVSYAKKPPFWGLVKAEQRALVRLEVPRLEHQVNQKVHKMQRSGTHAIRERLTALSQDTIQGQVVLLRNTLFTHRIREKNPLFWQQAKEVATGLMSLSQDARKDPYLRRGLAGSALTWAAWARVSQDEGARKHALALYESLGAELLARKPWDDYPLGFCTGLGGVVYSFGAGAALLGEEHLALFAAELAKRALVPRDGNTLWDVEGGTAGLLLGTWSLVEKYPELGQALLSCGYRLAADLFLGGQPAEPHLRTPGFAHGLTGVGAALGLVANASGDAGLLRKAWEALQEEEGAGHWLAKGEGGHGTHIPVDLRGWCHGPPGAFLARALVLSSDSPELLLEQEKKALTLALEVSPLGDPSLCCGTLARSEIFLVGGQLKGKESLLQRARTQAEFLLRSKGWDRLPATGGLFGGVEGLLFYLCRLLAPSEVGSVLFGQVLWR